MPVTRHNVITSLRHYGIASFHRNCNRTVVSIVCYRRSRWRHCMATLLSLLQEGTCRHTSGCSRANQKSGGIAFFFCYGGGCTVVAGRGQLQSIGRPRHGPDNVSVALQRSDDRGGCDCVRRSGSPFVAATPASRLATATAPGNYTVIAVAAAACVGVAVGPHGHERIPAACSNVLFPIRRDCQRCGVQP